MRSLTSRECRRLFRLPSPMASTVGQAPAGTRAIQLRDPDTFFSRFLELYGRANRGAIPERNNKPNLGQALHVLAGATYVDRLGRPNSRLARLLEVGRD